uniref:G-protein coupled receptors family 1 profile domain-containing protein n=1 Tax=Mandrillus leucophaeus TaxID=9568 RepID=A0A2K5Y4A5_MANLE
QGINYSAMTEFFLVGLSQYPELQLFLFMLCLIMYVIILLGNSILIIIRILDSRLHIPMYFFLGNLSFLDICYTSSSIPPMLIIFNKKSISFIDCALQMVVSLGLGSTECVLLPLMACDHYVAICNPLTYSIIMKTELYVQMAAWSWIIGCLNSLVQTVLTMILALLKVICSDISMNVFIMTVASIVLLVIPLLLIFISYVFILSSILRINSPKSKFTKASDEIIGLSYGVITPMLNPIIYSLRNKEVKEAVKKILDKSHFTLYLFLF